MSEGSRVMQKVQKQKAYMDHRTKEVEELSASVLLDLDGLEARVKQARQAAAGVDISVTNKWGNEEENKEGCVRSYSVGLPSTMVNEVRLLYAVDTEDALSGLLVHLPSTSLRGEARNFLALEMVDRRIRMLWNNGAGTQAIVSNVTLETARDLRSEDHKWYIITAQRYIITKMFPVVPVFTFFSIETCQTASATLAV